MAMSAKNKLISVAIGGAVLAIAVGILAYQTLSGPGRTVRQVKVDPKTQGTGGMRDVPAIPAKPEGEWLPKFKSIYSLAEGQAVKRIPKPFIPERLEFYRARAGAGQVQAIPRGPDFYLLDFDGTDFKMRAAWFGQPDLRGLFNAVLGIDNTLLIGPAKLLNQNLTGDVVLRTGSGVEQNREAFVQMIGDGLHRKLKLEQQDLDRQVIVVSGKMEYRAPATTQAIPTTQVTPAQAAAARRRGVPTGPHLTLYLGAKKGDGWTTQGTDQLIRQIAQLTGMPVIVDGKLGGANVPWEMDQSAYVLYNNRGGDPNLKLVDELLTNIANQSSLQFKREQRSVKTWVVTDEGPAPTTAPAGLPAAGANLP